MTMNPSGWMILQESFRRCKEKRSCNGERKNIANLFGCVFKLYMQYIWFMVPAWVGVRLKQIPASYYKVYRFGIYSAYCGTKKLFIGIQSYISAIGICRIC
jgi:hypothetical protein